MSTTFCTKCQTEHPGRTCDYDEQGECAETREPRCHIYRTYANLGITVCQNCAKFKDDIESEPHYIFEHGYCDPQYCPRCKAEVCNPPKLELIKL